MSKDGREAPPVSDVVALQLWAKSGGRCSFHGCNQYLLTDSLTQWDIKQGHIAHIVAASEGGPRGKDPLPMEQRSNIDNLMLVCQPHHTLIDNKSNEEEFPASLLRQFKNDHEQRIYELTACKPDTQSKVIAFTARIGRETVSVPYDQICNAMFQQGYYPLSKYVTRIDLTQFDTSESKAFYELATEYIASQIEQVFQQTEYERKPDHISIFALGPMPLLIYLGSQISNKVPIQLFQRHRDTLTYPKRTWTWKEEESKATYITEQLQEGTERTKVALLLSLSGSIDYKTIPVEIDEQFFVYQIRLEETPNPEFLRTPDDLARFRTTFANFISFVRAEHQAATIHLFPAVPAPVAVICGREILHKISPTLYVYDNNKAKGGFEFILEVD